jgi:hypothetical protein
LELALPLGAKIVWGRRHREAGGRLQQGGGTFVVDVFCDTLFLFFLRDEDGFGLNLILLIFSHIHFLFWLNSSFFLICFFFRRLYF